MPAVMRKPSTLKERLQQKGLAKLIMPKVSKILTNVVQLGPRVILRSATELLRVNPVTRIASVTSLTLIDIYLLIRKKISTHQFFINLTYSLTMFLGSTIGWYTGRYLAGQLALDTVLAFVVSIIFLLLGNTFADRLTRLAVSNVAQTDCQKGLAEINEVCPDDITVEVTKDQCIEVFRQNGEAKARSINEILQEAYEDLGLEQNSHRMH